jgi:hypothetical protein
VDSGSTVRSANPAGKHITICSLFAFLPEIEFEVEDIGELAESDGVEPFLISGFLAHVLDE